MLTDDGKHLYVSWDEYHMLIERLALKVHNSGWPFDQILCLARGGMRPGDVLSRVFDKPLAIMSTSSYRADAGTIQGRLDIAKYITMPKGELAGRVLLVDDLADSGVTLRAVVDRLRGMPSISELRSAVIWVKGVSSYTPDYFVERLPTSPWIHQPFEDYDGMRPARPGEEVLDLTLPKKKVPAVPTPCFIHIALQPSGAQERTRTSTELPAST
jgi:hypoxanthine phosphoribosyltransferase